MGLELETPKMIDGVDVTGWSAAQIDELRAILNEGTIADQEAAQLIAEKNLPANVLADRKKVAEFKKREVADVRALKAAKARFGEDDVGVIETRQGSIIMRTATPAEDDEQSDRAKAARERGASDDEIAFVQWQVLAKTVCYPSAERIDEITKKYPRVKELMWTLFIGLVRCSTERALGK